MTRTAAINAIELAGINGDRDTMIRLFTENRVSFMTAAQAYARGVEKRLSFTDR